MLISRRGFLKLIGAALAMPRADGAVVESIPAPLEEDEPPDCED